MSINYWDEWGSPVTMRDICDPDECGDEAADLPDLYLDTDDEWSRDAIIAMLILAFADDTQPSESPF